MKENLKILIVSLALDCPPSIWPLIRELFDLGHEVEIVVPDKGKWYKNALEHGIPVHIVPSSTNVKGFFKKRLVNIRAIVNLRKLYNQKHFDIIQLHLGEARILGRIAAIKMRKPPYVVSTIHGQDLILLKGYLMEKATNWIDHFTVAVSEDTEEYFTSKGFSKNKIKVIYNGLDIDAFNSIPIKKEHLFKELNLDEDVKLIGMIAHFYPTPNNFDIKGHKVFLKAARLVLERYENVRFVLVGKNFFHGHYMEEVQRYSKELDIDKFTYFLGGRNDIPNIIDSLYVLVLPSLIREGFGIVLIEAMARGVPVIGSNIGGIPEVIKDGETGLLVPPNNPQALSDAIVNLLSDPEKAKNMGKLGRERVGGNFTAKIRAKEYENLYYNIIKNSKIG